MVIEVPRIHFERKGAELTFRHHLLRAQGTGGCERRGQTCVVLGRFPKGCFEYDRRVKDFKSIYIAQTSPAAGGASWRLVRRQPPRGPVVPAGGTGSTRSRVHTPQNGVPWARPLWPPPVTTPPRGAVVLRTGQQVRPRPVPRSPPTPGGGVRQGNKPSDSSSPWVPMG